ncbi:hypothetical protein BG004_004046 [Podila humilis]|nr:hypothetical protein BG004_004046 [Podila humilis]
MASQGPMEPFQAIRHITQTITTAVEAISLSLVKKIMTVTVVLSKTTDVRAIFSDDACTIADKMFGQVVDPIFIDPSSDLNTILSVDENIIGNVAVKESHDWVTSKIVVKLSVQGSSQRVIDAVSFIRTVDMLPSSRTSRVTVGLTSSPTQNKKMMKGECVKVFVEIIYPKSSPGTGRLEVDVTAGHIYMRMDSSGTPAVFDSLSLRTVMGGVDANARVRDRTEIRTVKGNVLGVIRTVGQVDVQAQKGYIRVSVDDRPGVQGWDSALLDVKLSTGYGPIELKLVNHFRGHFLMTATFGQMEFRPSNRYDDQVHYTTQSSRQLSGWISKDGKEPSDILPRIELSCTAGGLKATIQDP